MMMGLIGAGVSMKETEDIFTAEFISELEADYKFLHQHAETGFTLPDTVDYVRCKLENLGYKTCFCGKSGLIATIGPNPEKGAFLLRADMDALRMQEETGLSYASHNGNMHACGHDAHTAMLLGAAAWLKKHEEELTGTVKLMFQPAEETLAGAKDMIESGVLENPGVTGAMMLHVMCGVPLETGTLIVSDAGVSAPAADFFTIEIQGRGCHASMPHLGRDPLTSAAHLMVALEEIKARELELSQRAVISIGALEGANAANVIPERVILRGSLRAFDDEIRNELKKRLKEMAEGIGNVFRTPAQVAFTSGAPTLINDGRLADNCYEILSREGLREKKRADAKPVLRSRDFPAGNSGGSEDFSYVSQKVPSVMVALAAGDSREGYVYPLHHPHMRLDLHALPVGVEALCRMALYVPR